MKTCATGSRNNRLGIAIKSLLLAKVWGGRVYPHKRVLVTGYALELIRLHLFVTLNDSLALKIHRYDSSIRTWLHIFLPLGDDTQVAKSVDVPPKALARFDSFS